MTNRSRLVRWSGMTSMVGGLLFAVGVAIHPLRHGLAVNAGPYSAIHVLIALALMLVLFGLTLFVVGYALFGLATMRAEVLPRWSGGLIAIRAVLYVLGGFSLAVFGPESPLVTIIETSGAVPS